MKTYRSASRAPKHAYAPAISRSLNTRGRGIVHVYGVRRHDEDPNSVYVETSCGTKTARAILESNGYDVWNATETTLIVGPRAKMFNDNDAKMDANDACDTARARFNALSDAAEQKAAEAAIGLLTGAQWALVCAVENADDSVRDGELTDDTTAAYWERAVGGFHTMMEELAGYGGGADPWTQHIDI